MRNREEKAICAGLIQLYQEERLASAASALDGARQLLADAIARVERQEQEYRKIQEDVSRNLHALDLVLNMASELEGRTPRFSLKAPEKPVVRLLPESVSPELPMTNEPAKSAPIGPAEKQSKGLRVVIRTTWPFRKSRDSRLSILQLD